MANIPAKDVMALRAKTGVGMMECKKALVEADGNFDEAVKLLREKGLQVADKKAARVAAEGVVDIAQADGVTAMVEVNAETDFVANNATFREFVKQILATIIKNEPADVAALLATKLDGSEHTVEEEVKDKIFTIGENISVRRFVIVDGVTGTYIHGGGRIGVMVDFAGGSHGVLVNLAVEGDIDVTEVGKNICMQIAAMNPTYVCKCCVPQSVLDSEKDILMNQIQNDEKLKNKPAAVIEKMVTGRLEKFYDNNCLNEQQYVREEDMKVKQYTESVAKALGGEIKISDFVKYERGEGIEKREDDFAGEIEKLVKG